MKPRGSAGVDSAAGEGGAGSEAHPRIRVVLPAHLCALAGTGREVLLLPEAPTLSGVLGALEAAYPVLVGTIRERGHEGEGGRRRPFVRFFACEEDLSDLPIGAELPEGVRSGREPLFIVGAMAGG